MKISVVTPSFNQGNFLERTLRSVLDQGWHDLEYIVIDGGSSDDSVKVLERFQDRLAFWVSEPDRGQAHAVNKGFERCTGDIIGWLNSDDVYRPGCLQAVASFFEARPGCLIAYGNADYIDQYDQVTAPYPTRSWDWKALTRACFICQPAAFFRRSVLDRFGGLDESLRYCMDYEYWLRCGRQVPIMRIDRTLAASRLYPENKTLSSRPQILQEALTMLKDSLGYVPRRWLAEYALEATRPMRTEGAPGSGPVGQSWHAISTWHRLHWQFNRGILPAYPLEMLTSLPLVPDRFHHAMWQHTR